MEQGMHQREGVCQILSPGERRMILLAGLLRITQYPLAMGRIEEAVDAGVDPIKEGITAMLLGVVQGESLLRVCVSESTLALPE
jgi:hypothetical protein